MQLERARASDVEALTRIAHSAKRYWGYPEPWIALWRDALTVTPEMLERQIIVCARVGTEPRGFYGLSGNGPTLELEHLWVGPEHIGRGIGRRLFEHALEAARAAGGVQLRRWERGALDRSPPPPRRPDPPGARPRGPLTAASRDASSRLGMSPSRD
jgi:GNAT superfamily N-acetyltransferase